MEEMIKMLQQGKEIWWENPSSQDRTPSSSLPFSISHILEAKERWERFAPLLRKLFPQTHRGIVDSPLRELKGLPPLLEKRYNQEIRGRVFAKMDCDLPIAGSIKARGGIYEVLKFTEKLLLEEGLLSQGDDYTRIIQDPSIKRFLSQYTVVVGSTGNLGLSVGIISRALGLNAEVHMSRDAKQWKKQLLKRHGVNIVEHDAHYSYAVKKGRERCENDRFAYFVDDEHSKELFLGYSVAAIHLKTQLDSLNIHPSPSLPICVYLPCGVGGAPGGISFGLRCVFGKTIRAYVAEPVGAPCVMLGLITGEDRPSLSRYNIKFSTEADGLAVPSPSSLALSVIKKVAAGGYTLHDEEMFWALYALNKTEDIKIEPSAGAGVKGVVLTERYLARECVHIIWLTGGSLVPEEEYEQMLSRGREIAQK